MKGSNMGGPTSHELVERLGELRQLLAALVSGGNDSCLNGTPMIPLHKDTVRDLLGYLDELADRRPPKAICGYPLSGWRLDAVRWDERDGQPDGWFVGLKREPPKIESRIFRVEARSNLGPLE